MVLKAISTCKKILIGVISTLACIALCFFCINNIQGKKIKQEASKKFSGLHEQDIIDVKEHKYSLRDSLFYRNSDNKTCYFGVQPHDLQIIEGNNGCSTQIMILEKNECSPKFLGLAFKPSCNKHDIFESYRRAMEEGRSSERDLTPFTLVDLNGDSHNNKIYYGMPRDLSDDVIKKHNLRLVDSYSVTYDNNEQKNWNFYEKDNDHKLSDRNTLMQVESIEYGSNKPTFSIHKIESNKKLPNEFLELLSANEK